MEMPTKDRILDVAEAVFAETGIKAASLRHVTSAAGVNLAAVNYHFGSKDGLVRAVLLRRFVPLNRARLDRLGAAEKRGITVEGILRAFLEPTMELSTTAPTFLGLLGRMQMEADPALKEWFLGQFAEVVARYKAALTRALPRVPVEELFWRMHFVLGAMFHTWTCARDLPKLSGGLVKPGDPRRMTDRLVAFGAAGLRAPVKGRKT